MASSNMSSRSGATAGGASRGEADDNWRRGGSNSGGARGSGEGGSNFRGSSGHGGFHNRDDRGGAGGGGYRDRDEKRMGGRDERGSRAGDNQGNWRQQGGSRGGDDRGSFNRRDGGSRFNNDGPPSSSTSERPRLMLKQRTAPAGATTEETSLPKQRTTPEETSSHTNDKPAPTSVKQSSFKLESLKISKANGSSNGGAEADIESPPAGTLATSEDAAQDSSARPRTEIKKREPPVVNTRAAALGASTMGTAPDSTKPTTRREPRQDLGPPKVQNSRFASLAEEDKEKNTDRDDRRGPPPQANSRFSKLAEADRSVNRSPEERGPPPTTNSRFAKAAEADRSSRPLDENKGPPPTTNSRFAKAAEADRSSRPDDRGPPQPMNSRFPEPDGGGGGRMSSSGRDSDRGPPPIANSRFAAAAALAEGERERDTRDGRPKRDGNDMRGPSDRRGAPPPLQQNSRFAAAAAADSDYVDRNERDRRTQDRERGDDRGGDRGDYRGGGGHRGGGGGGRYDRNNRDNDTFQREELPRGPASSQEQQQQLPSRVEQLLKPKSKADDVVLVPQTKEHEANMLKIPIKALQRDNDDDLILKPSKKKGTDKKPESDSLEPSKSDVVDVPPVPSVSNQNVDQFVKDFVNCGKLGDDLKDWCEDHMPPISGVVEKVILHLLHEREKLNPNPDCGWAESSMYGSALLSMINDELFNQMQVLWAIQAYCNKLGFPKLNGESVVQSMFRSMYKFDLVSDEAFAEWKEDESGGMHQEGKMTAIIQTVEWFNWLEQEEEDEEEEEEEE